MSGAPLVITAGEPAGIGPDLCIAIADSDSLPDFVVIGDAALLGRRAERLGANVTISRIEADSVAADSRKRGELCVIDLPFPAAVDCGSPDPHNAATLLEGLQQAVHGCQRGLFSGLVTLPVAKFVIADAGLDFSGHTELLAELTGAALPVMLLVAGDLRVALASTHLPLRDVPDAITPERLRAVIEVLDAGLRQRFGIERPRILVCGLNPHAGEGGHLGHEDRDVIAPVVDALKGAGLDLVGPLPADTAFTPAAGRADAVLAMYHDQGLPVLKYAGFGHAVNVTLGLPIVRTSVDHGTAFDIAGSGDADPGSTLAAIELAAAMAAGQ